MLVKRNESLIAMTAADLMSENPIVLRDEMTLRDAARLLLKAEISGAPVVDATGRCVGVLSAADFVRKFDDPANPAACASAPGDHFVPWHTDDVEESPTGLVKSWMTSDPVAVSRFDLAGDVAQAMVDARVHRVVVVDNDYRPVGVVTSTDVVAAVASSTRGIPE